MQEIPNDPRISQGILRGSCCSISAGDDWDSVAAWKATASRYDRRLSRFKKISDERNWEGHDSILGSTLSMELFVAAKSGAEAYACQGQTILCDA